MMASWLVIVVCLWFLRIAALGPRPVLAQPAPLSRRPSDPRTTDGLADRDLLRYDIRRAQTTLSRTPSTSSRLGFHQFGLLPQDIQNMIWKEVIKAIGRHVTDIRQGRYIQTCCGSHLRNRQFTSPCSIPSILHAYRNSRNLALRR
jgi:hypothetical protein